MKRILSLAFALALIIYALRRLNFLVKNVQIQSAQIEELQSQTSALRATLNAQLALMNEMVARQKLSETAIFEGAAERIARWNEHLSDLDSLN